MVFYWNLSYNKSLQVSRTLLSILAILNIVVVWTVSTCPLISKSSSPFNNTLVTVPKKLITIGIIVTFMFDSFFQLPSKVEVLILLFTFVPFYSVVSKASKVHQSTDIFSLFFSCWLLQSLVIWPRLVDPFICQNPMGVYVSHSTGQMLDCEYTFCSYGQILISCTTPSGSPYSPSRV